MIESILSLTFLAQVLRMFTPYYLGASAANFSERGGVINIAIEGFKIISAFSYAFFTLSFGNPFLSLILSVIVSLLFSLLYAFLTIKLKINQIVTGVGFNLLMAGTAKFLMMLVYQSSSNTPNFQQIPGLPFVSDIPVIGKVAGDYIIITGFALVFISQYVLFRTRLGLRLRSVGENPEAAETLGVKVRLYKMYGVLVCGALSALGGIWLASNQSSFSDGMIAGRGYIAIAAMIIGKWRPVNIFFACLMFAFFEGLEITLQISGSFLPSQIIQMLPYLITILVLIGFIGKTKPPAADGIPY
ncbi:MAG TPA: ABC transporter permease [Ignavibacteria bacterium]|nr:ABC transporter permease [Ignavibacteria bacterium]